MLDLIHRQAASGKPRAEALQSAHMEQAHDASYLSALTDAVLKPEEGQLSVDVHETPSEVVVRSAVAGVAAADIDVSVTHDTLTVRGTRHHDAVSHPEAVVHVSECFWGAFSRSIVLPCRVDPDRSDARMRNGVLTVTLPKAAASGSIPVRDMDM